MLLVAHQSRRQPAIALLRISLGAMIVKSTIVFIHKIMKHARHALQKGTSIQKSLAESISILRVARLLVLKKTHQNVQPIVTKKFSNKFEDKGGFFPPFFMPSKFLLFSVRAVKPLPFR